MNARTASDFFGLNRPQYVATPEVLLSSLAWRCAPSDGLGEMASGGLVYRALGRPRAGTVETSPLADDAGTRLDALRLHLGDDCGLDTLSREFAAKVVAEQLQGQAREKAKSVGVLPLSLPTALMQNAAGVLGVENPPNYGRILDRLFALGGVGERPASALLLDVYQSGHGLDAAMEWLAGCVEQAAPPELLELATRLEAAPSTGSAPAWLAGVPTPYQWFHDAWTSLCTGGWIGAMPRRRWVDWATCVLRTAIGAGFLYEMSFYHRLVLSLTEPGEAEELSRRVARPDPELLRWHPRQPVSKQDIAGAVDRLAHGGTACRTFLVDAQANDALPRMADYHDDPAGLASWLDEARGRMVDEDLRALRKQALSGGRSGPGKNVLETINGSLVARSGSQGWVDGYSLLGKRSRRFTIVEPGQDWLTVVASLSGRTAGNQSRVASLLAQLEALGLRPGYSTVVGHLESAGLARSSHDADDAIEIAAAF